MRNVLFLVSILLSSSVAPGSVEQQQRQEQARTEPEAAPTPLRVVGQAQTQEESDAWMAVQGAANLEEKARLAQDFLARFSESGLSGFAHQMLAAFFQQSNDYENFVHHAEKTLEDLPNDLLILSALAVAYAHRGQPEKAIAGGLRALQGLEAARKPDHRKASEWFMQKDQLLADANYALGSSHLQLYERDKTGENSRQNLTLAKATRYLQKAVELDPSYDLAYFRLAFAHVKARQREQGHHELRPSRQSEWGHCFHGSRPAPKSLRVCLQEHRGFGRAHRQGGRVCTGKIDRTAGQAAGTGTAIHGAQDLSRGARYATPAISVGLPNLPCYQS